MRSEQLDPAVLKLASEILTDRQLDIWIRTLTGQSTRGIAYELDIARTTVTDTLDAAHRKLRAHGLRFHPDGRPYLQETE